MDLQIQTPQSSLDNLRDNMPFAGSVHCCFSFAPRGFSPQKPTFPNSTSATNGRRRTTMWKCDRIFIHIQIHFFYSPTHKPIPVDTREKIQDEYKDLYILQGVYFLSLTHIITIF